MTHWIVKAGVMTVGLLLALPAAAHDEGTNNGYGPGMMGSGQGYGPGPGMTGPGYGGMGPGMMYGYGGGYGRGPGMMYGYGSMGPGMMGPGYGGMGPGMMYGYGPMGPGMMGPGYGGMGPGMMYGRGYGPGGMGWGRPLDAELTVDQVRAYFEARLKWSGNDHIKLGPVKEKDKDSIVVDIVTKDNSLVARYEVNRHTGAMFPVN